jgi:hypothetical protein
MTPSFFTSSSYLYHCHLFLSFNFENTKRGLAQLERPKGAKAHNAMWGPKVVEANNDIQHPKVAKSNTTMSVFYPFPFFSIFFFLIL